MKILFADKFQAAYLQQLVAAGHDCDLQPDLSAEELPASIAHADILVVRSTRVNRNTIEAADSLKMIIRAGAGTNTIDIGAASEKNIPVCNVPGKNSLAVAELAFGLLLSIDRNIPDAVNALRAGQWDKKKYSKAEGIYGRNLGIVGLGGTGVAMAERGAAFGMHVHIIAKPSRDPEITRRLQAIGATEVDDIETLVGACDVVSLHVPANADTTGLIGDSLLAKFQDGAILLNLARGDIVDDEALIRAMEAKGIRAGLDVYNGEPAGGQASFTSTLAQHPNVYGTHHVGASTAQAQNAVAEQCVRIIEQYSQGKVLNCVNR